MDASGGKRFEALLQSLEGNNCSLGRCEAAVQTESCGMEVLCAEGQEAERDLPRVPLAVSRVETIFKYVTKII
jgi:hypothetical protein